MTTVMGFDNSALLPPFMPIMRGEDGLFGATLWKCFQHGYVGHLPWAVAHDPAEVRPPLDKATDSSAVRRNLNDLLVHIMLFADTGIKGAPADRLRSIGTQLSQLGSLPLPAFEEYVRVHSWQLQAPFLAALELEVSSTAPANSVWAKEMQRYIEHLRDYLLSAEYILPQDLAEGRNVDEARELTRKFVFEYGQLLYWWPEIVAAAKRLRAQGRTLAVPA